MEPNILLAFAIPRIERVRVSIASPLIQPSPFDRRVGIRIVTFEACSGFTHVTAHRIAQPPKAAFVTRLQPCRLPGRTARQLPDQSTTPLIHTVGPIALRSDWERVGLAPFAFQFPP
jgi:hypothetical protein